MKIKIIDLLNKIANGEETINVKTKYDSLSWKENDFLSSIYYEFNSRTNAEIVGFLNDYVEILDEPKENKIEYLDDFYIDNGFGYSIDLQKVKDKINELIDAVNELKRDK